MDGSRSYLVPEKGGDFDVGQKWGWSVGGALSFRFKSQQEATYRPKGVMLATVLGRGEVD